MKTDDEIRIGECDTVELLNGCVELQRSVFDLPEVEISPVRHFIVTKHAGGFTLGAFSNGRLIGFTLSVPAVLDDENAFYSHMTAVESGFQGHGIGARLKWAQRKRSLDMGVKVIKWTFQPEKARNAFFNLEKLGAEVRDYMPNFYGTDYGTDLDSTNEVGVDSDRLFAIWKLESDKVCALSEARKPDSEDNPAAIVSVPWDWEAMLKSDRLSARSEQQRIKHEFTSNLAEGLVCRGFLKDKENPGYLFFKD